MLLAIAPLSFCVALCAIGLRGYMTEDVLMINSVRVEGPVLRNQEGGLILGQGGIEFDNNKFIILDHGGVRIGFRDSRMKEILPDGGHIGLIDPPNFSRYIRYSQPSVGYPLVWSSWRNPRWFGAGSADDDTNVKIDHGQPVEQTRRSYAVVFPIWLPVIVAAIYPLFVFHSKIGQMFFKGMKQGRT